MWFYLFIQKYLREDYNLNIQVNNIKSIVKQMLKEGYLTASLIDAAKSHEGPGDNEPLHEIVSKIAVFVDSDNYRLFPTTIKITRETKDKLDALKLHHRETYEDVILRLLSQQ